MTRSLPKGRLLITIAFFLRLVVGTAFAQQVFINEIHYDNDSTDVGEFVEIAGPAGKDLSGYSLYFYNGNGGASYKTVALSGSIPDQDLSGYGTLSFAISGIQNGDPDGLALYDEVNISVVQFLSYEGTFAATSGVATGMQSVDIGVSESTSSPAGESLQLKGTGADYADFAWASPSDDSPSQINAGQTFTGPGGDPAISLSISPAYVKETDGVGAAIGTLTVTPTPVGGLNVSLRFSVSGEITVPSSVFVSASGTSTFSIDALEDGVTDGPRLVIVTASDAGGNFASGSAEITVTDSDRPPGRGSALRVAGLNVLNGVGVFGTAEFNAQLALLSRLDADVICFTEVKNAGNFADMKALLQAVGYQTDDAHFAVKGDAFANDPHVSGDFGSGAQSIAVVSRHPITEVVQIGRGIAGRMELTRYPLFVTIDVPGTDEDPAIVAVHLKAGNSEVDHFRKAVEAYRIGEFLLGRGYDGAVDNLFIIGDVNEDWDNFQPNSIFTGLNLADPQFGDGSTFPLSYVLGSDIAEANGITINYNDFPVPSFQNFGMSVLDTRQADDETTRTYNLIGEARLDYIIASERVRTNGNSPTEIYNSSLETSYAGLSKNGVPLAGEVAFLSSDHFAVFGDFELEPIPKVSLTFAQNSIVEMRLPLTFSATLSVSESVGLPVDFLLSGEKARNLRFPSSVTMPAGGTQVSFDISVAAQFGVQPDCSGAITASAAGYSAGRDSVRVINRDPSGLVLISQYIETDSGTTPKAIELYNNSGAEISFSATPLIVFGYFNGSSVKERQVTIDRGFLPAGGVLVIGDSGTGQYLIDEGVSLVNPPDATPASADTGTLFLDASDNVLYVKRSFSFNGDDALEVCLGFAVADVFGDPGSSPGAAWTGSGVSTANNNLEIRSDVQTGSARFTDPSTRYLTLAGGSNLVGFGVAPVLSDPYAVWAATFSLSGLDYPPANDPDGDGVINVLEFALGGNPRSYDPDKLSEYKQTGVFGGIEFDRTETPGRLEMVVESSVDLISWQENMVQDGVAVSNGDGTEHVVFRSVIPLATDARRVFRVRVSLP